MSDFAHLSVSDMYKYRKQRGVNLGSGFTLEPWIASEPFRRAAHPAQSDYDVSKGPDAKQILEQHWDTWITTDDWAWMSEHGINTVRIPIGFYHAYGADPSVVHDTDFADVGDVFAGAWTRISKAIDVAESFGIGVLIDLHAAPGKQNGDSHSGQTGPVRFYEPRHLMQTQKVLCLIANALKEKVNVVGLQLVNEPQYRSELCGWYASTIAAIRRVNPDLPLYIHDAWKTDEFAHFAGSQSEFVVVDHHLYRCFTGTDHQMSGDEHARAIQDYSSTFANLTNTSRGNFVAAEFSAALNPASLRSGEAGEQDRQRRVFARAELEMFEQCAAGWFFWTYRSDHWDAGWSNRDAVTAAIMPDFVGIRKKRGQIVVPDATRREDAKGKAFEQHAAYWKRYDGSYEHWRFAEGFSQGWEDVVSLMAMKAGSCLPELGFKGQMAKLRVKQHSEAKGSSNCLWEFEHGFSQGADAASAVVRELN